MYYGVKVACATRCRAASPPPKPSVGDQSALSWEFGEVAELFSLSPCFSLFTVLAIAHGGDRSAANISRKAYHFFGFRFL